MSKPYDPKLRKAAEEFTALCKKYDCVGSAIFVSPTHAEFVHQLEPTWSVMRIEPQDDGGAGIRFRSKAQDFDSKEAQEAHTAASAHAVTTLLQHSERSYGLWRGLLEKMQEQMTVLYRTWGSKPDSVPGDGQDQYS